MFDVTTVPSFHLTKEITIVTHDGVFHADDVIAVAIMRGSLANLIRTIRTRDPREFETADILVDVGAEYDPERGRFDHHQKGFTEQHEGTEIPYAAAGLAWRYFGKKFVQMHNPPFLDPKLCDAVFDRIMNDVMIEVDALDNGIAYNAKLGINTVISSLNPAHGDYWVYNAHFERAVELVRFWLANYVNTVLKQVTDHQNAIEAFSGGDDIVTFDQVNTAWKKVIGDMLRRGEQPPKLVVYPDPTGLWRVQTTPSDPDNIFSMSCPAPSDWRGKRQFMVGDYTPVDFVHPNGFIGGAPTREAATAMAQEWIRLSEAERQ